MESAVDMDCLQTAKLYTGPYRVVRGDVLEFTMPALLQGVTAAQASTAQTQVRNDHPYICRVSPKGMITLPAVGEMEVAGRSLAEIEEQVIDAYRQYVAVRPSVLVRVLEYKTCRVSITGAVVRPGVYSLRQDQMSLASLLMEAGGVIEGGAAVIRIGRLNPTGTHPANNTLAAKPPPVQEPQEVEMTGSPRSAAISQPPRTPADSAARIVFEREGPLNATGWLAWEQGGRLLVRRWLDLGNGLQRQAFVGAVAVQPRWAAVDTLETRLAVLAEYLESQADHQSGESTVLPSGWELTGKNQFVAPLRGALTDAEGDSWKAPVTHAVGATNRPEVTTLVVPVRTMNVPLRDVALEGGDTILVERMAVPMFCVLGLVNRPGNFPYPPMTEYNVTQAIAFAGGLNPVADPRYVTVYRLTRDGSIVRVPFQLIEHGEFTKALGTPIKPGDVVAVEHTLRTRMNTIINSLVRVNVGVYLAPRDLWNQNNQ